ncbi:hypothetical protein SNOG_08877 [Parastagonospora nodorum SN15]|uniref:Heterokaryon incompatibility domain-containing protein n=1 Tax=Phaeosphaeria nodorum (strain SN15 / ATCC MYA-4574 / FGSC 10173) TaxID=321614 RepID=Q0UH87_PHANO|nr:hypothetical protein SNOG_08877 [Parastagonospora nodorum SN15]EAT84045.2 hypothetical protein SNOG_08877 [Parastagonospora nodorum SN15]
MTENAPVVSELCDICRTIDFATYFQPPVEGEPATKNGVGGLHYKSRELGLRADLGEKKASCAFCRLVYAATDVFPRSERAAITVSSVLCGTSRTEDGVKSTSAYYMHVLINLNGSRTSTFIQLLADSAHLLGLRSDFLARIPRQDTFDMRQALEWIEKCKIEHGSLCDTLEGDTDGAIPTPQPDGLLAIDLLNMCICHMPEGSEYAALSYCWPKKAYLTLLKENRAALFELGALEENMSNLPGTIQDAISCTKELKIRYLWIDALCIVQDDVDQKGDQLRQMDRVYNCASLTKPLGGVMSMLLNYEYALSAYTYREVSYASDMLNAFDGIKAVLSDAMQTDFWQGIPEKIFPQALCWQLRGSYRRRRLWPADGLPSEPLFASWTWAGWESSVNLNDYMSIQMYRTEAEFYIINDDAIATRLAVEPEWESMQNQRAHPLVIKAFLPNIVPRHMVDASSKAWRNARTLGVWTTSASFILDGTHHVLTTAYNHEKLWRDSTNFAIKDQYGDTAGSMLLPKTYFEDFGADWVKREFILISRSLPLESQITHFDEKLYDRKKGWCCLNVMMISRTGEYTAFRAGMGILHKEAWVKAKPMTTFVKLM